MGKIENAAGANLRPRRQKTFEESLKAFEVAVLPKHLSGGLVSLLTLQGQQLNIAAHRQVLPEVLQQHARIDDPSAARRREIIR